MNFKLPGIIAIICAPAMYIDFAISEQNANSWKTGLFGLIYMTGWICSIVALKRMEILGKSKWAKVAFTVQLTLLTLAQIWNVWVIFGGNYNNLLFRILDITWPLSNIWMLAIGITAVKAKRLQGWKRFVPLFVGLWFPLTVIPAITIGFYSLAGPYSAVAFMLLGLVVYTGSKKTVKEDEAVTGSIAIA